MNLKEWRTKWLWENLKYSSGNYLEELRKTTKHTDKAWSILWLTNCSPPEYISAALSLEPTCLALNGQKR